MKKKMKPVHFLILFLLVVLTICATFSSRILGLYYQIEGGNLLTKVLKEAYPEQPDAIPCTLAPLTDPNWREQTAKAIDDLEKALKYDPSLAQAALLAGRGYCLLGEGQKAVGEYQKFTNLSQSNPIGYIEMGFAVEGDCIRNWRDHNVSDVSIMTDNYCNNKELLSSIKQLWEKGGLSGENLWSAGEQSRLTKRYSDAILWYQRSYLISPTGDSLYSTGLVFQNQGKLSEAEIAYKQALSAGNFSGVGISDVYFSLGTIYQRGEGFINLTEALRMYNTAIDNDHFSSNTLKSEAYYRCGEIIEGTTHDFELASAQYQQSLSINPTNYWARMRYGKALYWITGNLDIAVREINVAISQWPEEVNRKWAYRALGDIYSEAGLIEKARMAYEESLLIDPEDKSIRDILQNLGK